MTRKVRYSASLLKGSEVFSLQQPEGGIPRYYTSRLGGSCGFAPVALLWWSARLVAVFAHLWNSLSFSLFRQHRLFVLATCLATVLLAGMVPAQGPFPFQDPNTDPEARITDLLGRMTLNEKIDALSTNPTVPRLGVVGTGHVEGLHGLALGGPGGWEGKNQTVIPTTTFPQARGLGQTWDPALLEKVATLEAYETDYALGKYHRGGRVVRAPNADLSRDPRWGRSEESYGEDPYLVGTLATAFTRGLQGEDSRYWATASLLKHYLANSNEDLRDSSS